MSEFFHTKIAHCWRGALLVGRSPKVNRTWRIAWVAAGRCWCLAGLPGGRHPGDQCNVSCMHTAQSIQQPIDTHTHTHGLNVASRHECKQRQQKHSRQVFVSHGVLQRALTALVVAAGHLPCVLPATGRLYKYNQGPGNAGRDLILELSHK